ncbi:MAG: hypothetical protein OHK005_16970 [Candidatus Methylacidiphilales bacterium]
MDAQARQELLAVLERYFNAVASQKTEQPEDLMTVFAEVDAAEARHREAMPPMLRHFFEGKSYRKAYDFLKAMAVSE